MKEFFNNPVYPRGLPDQHGMLSELWYSNCAIQRSKFGRLASAVKKIIETFIQIIIKKQAKAPIDVHSNKFR